MKLLTILFALLISASALAQDEYEYTMILYCAYDEAIPVESTNTLSHSDSTLLYISDDINRIATDFDSNIQWYEFPMYLEGYRGSNIGKLFQSKTDGRIDLNFLITNFMVKMLYSPWGYDERNNIGEINQTEVKLAEVKTDVNENARSLDEIFVNYTSRQFKISRVSGQVERYYRVNIENSLSNSIEEYKSVVGICDSVSLTESLQIMEDYLIDSFSEYNQPELYRRF